MMSQLNWRNNGKRFFYALTGFFVFVISFLAFSNQVYAATCLFTTTEPTNDWNIAANWDCGYVPGVADSAVIPASTSTNLTVNGWVGRATVNSGATINAGIYDLRFDDIVFVMDGGMVTSTSGNFIFNAALQNGGKVGTVNGDMWFGATTSNVGAGAYLDFGSGVITFSSGAAIENTGTINAGSADVHLYDEWTNGGVFNRGTSKLTFEGSEQQYIPPVYLYDVEINKTGGSVYLSGNLFIFGDLTITNGIFNLNSQPLYMYGDWRHTGGLFVDAAPGIVYFDGHSPQTIWGGDFTRLTLRNDTTVTLGGDVDVSSEFLISNLGTLNAASYTFQPYGLATIGVGTTVTSTSGNLIFNSVTSSGIISTGVGLIYMTSTTNNGTIVSGSTGSLQIHSTTTNNGTIDHGTGSFYIASSGHLVNNGTINSYGSLQVLGEWVNNGTYNPLGSMARVDFNGSLDQDVPATAYRLLVINKTGGTATLLGEATTTDGFWLQDGTFALGSNTLHVGTDWSHTGGTLNGGTGTVDFNGSSNQNVSAENSFYNVTMSKPAGTVLCTGDVRVNGVFISSGSGTWNCGTNGLQVIATTTIGAGTVVTSTSGHFTFNNEVTNNGSFGTDSGLTQTFATTTNNGVWNVGSYQWSVWGLDPIVNTGTINGNSGTITLRADFSPVGIFNPGTGTVELVGSLAQDIPATTYYNLTINKLNASDIVTFVGNVTTTNEFYIQQGVVNLGSYTLAVGGDWKRSSTITTTFNPGTGLVRLYGSQDADLYYGNFVDLEINKIGASVFNYTVLALTGDLTVTGSGTFNIQSTTLSVDGTVKIDSVNMVTSTDGVFIFNGSVTSTGNLGTQSGSMTFNDTYVNYGLFEPGVSGSTITHNATTTNNGIIDQTSATSHIIYNDDMINNGTINTNGKLTFNAGFVNNGTFTALGSNQTVFGGSNDQIIPSLTMDSFILEKTAGIASLGGNSTTTVAFSNSSSTLSIGDYALRSAGTYSNTGLVTENATSTILHPGSVKITDSLGVEVATIAAPGNIYVTVTDANRNLDGSVADTFQITLTAGGDSETFTLTETGIATGVFRNTAAILLVNSSAIGINNGQIALAADTVGNVTYTDNQDSSDTSSDSATFDFTGSTSSGSSGGGGGGGGGSYIPLTITPTSIVDQALLDNLKEIGVSIHALVKLPDDGDIDTQADSAVYYVGSDGRRHAFPNAKVYFTWFSDFSGVSEISHEDLASIPLGTNVTYKPGVRMVKFMTDSKVYAISKGGVLHWVMTEAAAKELYGDLWNRNIDDISDAFYMDYKFAQPDISGVADFNPADERASVTYPSDSLMP